MADRNNDAGVIGISAAVVYDVISATNSSPQTTEINAQFRVATLMKWVKLGLAQAVLFILLMTLAEPPGKKWRPITGGGIAAILLWAQYVHAANAGTAHPGMPTESYIPGSYGTGADPNVQANIPPQPTQVGGGSPSISQPRVRSRFPKYKPVDYAQSRGRQNIQTTGNP